MNRGSINAQANKTAKKMNSRTMKVESEWGRVLRKLSSKTFMFLGMLFVALWSVRVNERTFARRISGQTGLPQ